MMPHYYRELPTTCLVVDNTRLHNNLDRMSRILVSSRVRLRPHAKAHKCPHLALLQLKRGAVGICCQTIREVEEFAAACVQDILLTNQIADRHKAIRLASVPGTVTIGICVDNMQQVRLLDDAASARSRTINIYVEFDVGGARCGVD
jgi:D-serine deaminase-like pyridoxal phosphate-dependent protein